MSSSRRAGRARAWSRAYLWKFDAHAAAAFVGISAACLSGRARGLADALRGAQLIRRTFAPPRAAEAAATCDAVVRMAEVAARAVAHHLAAAHAAGIIRPTLQSNAIARCSIQMSCRGRTRLPYVGPDRRRPPRHRRFARQRAPLAKPTRQIATLEMLHHHVRSTVLEVAHVDDPHDVLALDSHRRPRFAFEPLHRFCIARATRT